MVQKITFLLLLTGCLLTARTQTVSWQKIEKRIAEDEAAARRHHSPAKALLLGTFHFNYPNLDEHKIDSSRMINVLSPTRQQEIRQVTEVLKAFKPTRIYVEAQEGDQPWLDSLYSAYRSGSYKLGRNEIFQLGFRLAGELNHPKLYAVDDQNFVRDNYKRYTWIDSLWKGARPVDSLQDQRWNAYYKNLYQRNDSQALDQTLLETFLILSDRRTQNRSHGHYMVGGFNTEDDRGPDALSLWWYNRNLRIMNNILKTKPGPDDRILVIFGSGHMPILRHLMEGTPLFDVVELKDLVKPLPKKL